jgi:hypothetical protein
MAGAALLLQAHFSFAIINLFSAALHSAEKAKGQST